MGVLLPVLFRLHNLDFVGGCDPSLLLRLATVAAHTLLAYLVVALGADHDMLSGWCLGLALVGLCTEKALACLWLGLAAAHRWHMVWLTSWGLLCHYGQLLGTGLGGRRRRWLVYLWSDWGC